jgi:hypothetical protein
MPKPARRAIQMRHEHPGNGAHLREEKQTGFTGLNRIEDLNWKIDFRNLRFPQSG